MLKFFRESFQLDSQIKSILFQKASWASDYLLGLFYGFILLIFIFFITLDYWDLVNYCLAILSVKF